MNLSDMNQSEALSSGRLTVQDKIPSKKNTVPINPYAARLTVVETTYHQLPHEQPTVIETRFFRELISNEQPYGPRKKSIGESWEQVDTGWIKGDLGTLVIKNEEGKFFQMNPTPLQIEEMQGRVIEVGMMDDHNHVEEYFQIAPQDSLRLMPIHPEKFHVRCRKGRANYVVVAYPR